MGNPWLSVIIPSHNDQRWLGAALRSLVDQIGAVRFKINNFLGKIYTEIAKNIPSSISNKIDKRSSIRRKILMNVSQCCSTIRV